MLAAAMNTSKGPEPSSTYSFEPQGIVDDGAGHAAAHHDQPPFRRRTHAAGCDIERRGALPSADLERGRPDRDALVGAASVPQTRT